MKTLPRAMRQIGDPIYRGFREDSRANRYSFWAVDRDYAESYGDEVIEGRLPVDAAICDVIPAIDAEGLIHDSRLDAILPGLAEACGIDAETEIECERLWDTAGDDLTTLADLLDVNGYDGLRWVEQDRRVAYLLIH